jgi:hypothetical protein
MFSHLHGNKVFHQYQDFLLDKDIVDKHWVLANKIDVHIGHAFQLAEASCYKHPKLPWSEKLHLTSLKVKFWRTALTERLTKVPQSAVLRNLAAEIWKTAPPPRVPKQIRILKSVGTAAQRALRRIRRDAAKEHELFLNELKSRLAQRMLSKDTDVDAAIKNIDRQLKDAEIFQRIAQAVKPQNSAPLTNVEIVTTTSHLHPVTGKVTEISTIKHLKRHFCGY